MGTMDDPDLEFVATSRLLKEITKRMDAMVFIGATNRTEDQDALAFGITGAIHSCLGLLEAGRIMILNRGWDEDETAD